MVPFKACVLNFSSRVTVCNGCNCEIYYSVLEGENKCFIFYTRFLVCSGCFFVFFTWIAPAIYQPLHQLTLQSMFGLFVGCFLGPVLIMTQALFKEKGARNMNINTKITRGLILVF